MSTMITYDCATCGRPIDPTTEDYSRYVSVDGTVPIVRVHVECDPSFEGFPALRGQLFTHNDPRPWHCETRD